MNDASPARSTATQPGSSPRPCGAETLEVIELLASATPDSAPPRRRLAPTHSGARLLEGRFLLGQLLGRGAMGSVYAATDTLTNQDVALKALHCADGAAIYYLKHEFRTLAALDHPNLVRVHELHCDGDQWFFTMEHLNGQSFLERLGHRAPAERVRRAFARLAEGVRALHRIDRVHRDLKPSNVLWTDDDRIVVLDLGLVSENRPGGIGQTLNLVSGTPAYMAPEQAAAMPATKASDWYAVGAMLYEALTGRVPFEHMPEQILIHKQTRDPVAPTALGLSVDANLEALCMALLQRDPAHRPDGDTVARVLRGGALRPARRRVRSGAVRRVTPESKPERQLLAALRETDRGKPVVRMVDAGELERAGRALAAVAQGDRAVVLSGRSSQRERMRYNAFDGIVDALSRHLRRIPDEEASALLPRHVRSLIELFPVIERVPCARNARQRSRPPGDEGSVREQGTEALRELLCRLAERQPVALLLEDAQHADAESLRLMVELLASPDPPPLLLVLAHSRPSSDQAARLAHRFERDTGLELKVLSLRQPGIPLCDAREPSGVVAPVASQGPAR